MTIEYYAIKNDRDGYFIDNRNSMGWGPWFSLKRQTGQEGAIPMLYKSLQNAERQARRLSKILGISVCVVSIKAEFYTGENHE